jgi:hypothetical protein
MGSMTCSRKTVRAVMIRAGLWRNPVAAGSAQFDDEALAPEFSEVICGLADRVVGLGLTGHGLHLGGELGDGEAVGRYRQSDERSQSCTDPGLVDVHPSDPGGTDLRGSGQLVEELVPGRNPMST